MKIPALKSGSLAIVPALCGAILALPSPARAQISYTINDTIADAFLSAASPGLNFGTAGTLAISPASAPEGEFDSVIMFNTAAAVAQFNSIYGVGTWQITGVKLSLSSNKNTQGQSPGNTLLNTVTGGNFNVTWISDNSWVEGSGGGSGTAGYPTTSGVDYNSVPTLLSGTTDSLGTFTYTPPGNTSYLNYALSLNPDLVSSAAAGGDLSLYFSAADNQVGYLFNSKDFASGHPELTLTAVPEPSVVALAGCGIAAFLAARRRSRQ
jgi:hypothetical protein